MDYPCAKFGDFSFSHFDFIVRTNRITDRITEADERYTHATIVGVSNDFLIFRVRQITRMHGSALRCVRSD